MIRDKKSKSELKKTISNHDRIIMLGHGSHMGLMGFDGFVIDSTFAHRLRHKKCVFIWCNADVFVANNRLSGFNTGMIISEYEEAVQFSVPTTYQWIEHSNTMFAEAIKQSIDNDDMVNKVLLLYDGNTAVEIFNRNNIYFS